MATLKKRLMDALLQAKLLTPQDLEKAEQIQAKTGENLKDILVKQGFVKEKDLIAALAKELFIPYLELAKYKIDAQVVEMLPEKVARQYKAIPLSKIGNVLSVAMSDPLNVFAIDDLKAITGHDVDIVLASEKDIIKALDRFFKGTTGSEEMAAAAEEVGGEVEVVKTDGTIELGVVVEESEKAPIVKIVDLMLTEALKKRASDIHVEPMEHDLRIRYRIDGHLFDVFRLPKKNQNAVLARLKIISGLDITEARLPQDGRFKVKLKDREIDFRVSALPTTFGQKFVLRTLDKSKLSVGFDSLGMTEEPRRLFEEAIIKPYGMILITGPTGCGKSTTLYSILNKLNKPESNIVTIEDPVEYQVEGITQIAVRPEIGLTFASGLRSVLRQSPDVVMVGEIRDSETADIAIKASLTGQVVLSTLHTNDAVGAITRLIDMGIEPFLVASSLIVTSAKRLCRRICQHCKEPIDIPRETWKKLGLERVLGAGEKPTFFKGKGCHVCNNSGYFERIGIHEVLMIDDAVRGLIIQRASSGHIKEFAMKEKGMRTLRDDAMLLVARGITTIEEALRATTEE
ncbi:type II secretion system protein E [Candidatus Velamenicoccus archaeovorus]|uniref:Type II secretion system protein E n=2 Tax=Velamenicoccus archaeovorus TaxID=1930593 RepID=A0A410P545_VELA1|nr:type II secretion system protein E [Candidatus Velamenicoccus archaeovorus]